MDGGSTFLLIVFILVMGGIVLPIALGKSRVLKKAADKLPPVYKLVTCDCGADVNCPQGKAVTEVRCKIWKQEKV